MKTIVNDVDVKDCDSLVISNSKLQCTHDFTRYKNCKDNPNCKFKCVKRLEDKLSKISEITKKYYLGNSGFDNEVAYLAMCDEINGVING